MNGVKKHVPNALGILRLLLGLLFPLLTHQYRIYLVIVAALTDVIDGPLARRWKAESRLGQIIDPIADKVFIGIMALTFLFEARLTPGQMVLIASRDLIVATGAFLIYATGRSREIFDVPSRYLGKITTVLQVLFLISILFLGQGLWPLAILTGVFSLAAGIDYALHYLRHARVISPEVPERT